MKRGEVYLADLGDGIGSEQFGSRPVVVIQNDTGNEFSGTTIICAISSRVKRRMPTHIRLERGEAGLSKCSVVLAEQIRTIDKDRIKKPIGIMPEDKMKEIDMALKASIGLDGKTE